MARFADGPEVEVSAQIEASQSAVWELISDINLAGRFQDEFIGAEWVAGDAPGLGARFVGKNQRGDASWQTTSLIVSYQPERKFGWAVTNPDDDPGATWTYLLDPTSTGTRLTFHRLLGPGPSGVRGYIEKHPEREEEIIASRDETHRANMQAVVDGIKALPKEPWPRRGLRGPATMDPIKLDISGVFAGDPWPESFGRPRGRRSWWPDSSER